MSVFKAIVILVPLQLVQVFGTNKVGDSCLKSISDKLTATECKTLIHNLEKATGLNLFTESAEGSLACILSLLKLNNDSKYSQNGTKGILLKGLEFIRKKEVKECLEKEYPDFLLEEDEGPEEASEDLQWKLGDSSLTEGLTFAALLIIAILVIGFQTYTFARDFVRMSGADPSMPATCLFDQELGKISGSESESEEENIELETRTLISSTRVNETSSQIKNMKFA